MSALTSVEVAPIGDRQIDLLRVLICGSVDDGKSTLLGRLLYDADLVADDHLAALERDSKRFGTRREGVDLSLLVDGLTAEREQGITIDVAYRYVSTKKRRFIIADAPGHEQYTRNMVTGASGADLAVLLVDARKGLLAQTRRHSFLAGILGIRTVVLAVNKLDLVGYSEPVFDDIADSYRTTAASVGISKVVCIPVSALQGDNIVRRGERTPWYDGPTLLGCIETIPVNEMPGALRLPVQWVSRPNPNFRGYAGPVVSGTVRVGDAVRIVPSGATTTVRRLVTMAGDRDDAVAGESVMMCLSDEVDVSRGDLICAADSPAQAANQFEARVVWMSEHRMLPGRPYLVKAGTRTIGAVLDRPKFKFNVTTLEHVAARTLEMNEIGVCNVHLDQPIGFDPYEQIRDTGAFIVIDRMTNATVGAGMLLSALPRSANVRWQALDVDKAARATLMGQRPCVIWLTGLSAAGKSTLANGVEKRLHASGYHTHLLDGDNVRHGLNRDLGFSEADRVENIRRVAEVASLMLDAGLIVLVSLISPFAAERRMARDLVGPGEFCEVFVDAPLAVAEARDPKGLYRKARSGQLPNFTGIHSPYEEPVSPEVRVDTASRTPDEGVEMVIDCLGAMGVLGCESSATRKGERPRTRRSPPSDEA